MAIVSLLNVSLLLNGIFLFAVGINGQVANFLTDEVPKS